MFSTFKYDKETREVQELRSAFDPVTARSSQHQACNNCHAKKLRCSGERGGCERCAASKLPCEYTRSNSRSSRRGKKPIGRRSSSDSGSRDYPGAGGGDSSPGSQSGKSSSRHHHHHLSKHSKHASKSSSSSRSHREDDDDDDDRSALEQLDPSMLAPEDGFDLHSLSIAGGSDIMGTAAAAGYASSIAGLSTSASDYYGQQAWQAATAAPQPAYDASSYMGTSADYAAREYYAGYTDYTQFQHQHDPRYWPEGGR